MAKVSQLDKAIAMFTAERAEAWQAAVQKNAIFQSLINALEAQKTRPVKKPPASRKAIHAREVKRSNATERAVASWESEQSEPAS